MDRNAIARSGRRGQALEALAFEQEREAALLDQIAQVVLEQDGRSIDEAAFATMSAEDAELVRDALGDVDDPFGGAEPDPNDVGNESDVASEEATDDEVERLESELALGRARRRAIERYIEALDAGTAAG